MDERKTITAAGASSPVLEPVPRYDTLADRAYEQLKHALMAGSFQPGQKLTIRKLAASLGVSTTPARDALSRLISEGVLESDANRNVFAPRLDPAKLQELYFVRLALEGPAAELGAARMSPAQVDDLEQVQTALIAALDRKDYARALRENERFHFSIYAAAGNRTLLDAIQQVWLKLGPTLNFLYPAYNHSRRGVSHHVEVIDALRRGDAKAVRAGIERSLRAGELELVGALQASPAAAANPIAATGAR